MKNSYFTIAEEAEAFLKEKGSKFITFARPVRSLEEVKAFLTAIQEIHPKASHHCYAYRLGLDKQNNYRANDDGEPSGTAGKPILGQIDSKGVTNVMVIVVRYFGGTKLGVTGLIQSYKASAKEVLENAKVIEHIFEDYFELSFQYPLMNEVMRLLKRHQVNIIEQKYDNECKVFIRHPQSKAENLKTDLMQLHQLKISYLYTA